MLWASPVAPPKILIVFPLKIPDEIKQASHDFVWEHPDFGLIDDWLTMVQAVWWTFFRLIDSEDWFRFILASQLSCRLWAEIDLLRTNLFALCDRKEDLPDCIALTPAVEELFICTPWVTDRDRNPFWPNMSGILLLLWRKGSDMTTALPLNADDLVCMGMRFCGPVLPRRQCPRCGYRIHHPGYN